MSAADSPELETIVTQFQEAARANHQHACTDIFPRARALCRAVVLQVQRGFSGMGSFVEDVADEKLADCLLAFQPNLPGGFRAFYRKALTNAAIDEYRRAQRLRHQEWIDDVASAEQDVASACNLDEQLRTYAIRKRRLVDALRFSPIFKLSTLLLDQRQRTARMYAPFREIHPEQSTCTRVESLERWHDADPARRLADAEPSVGEVWACFAETAESRADPLEQRDLVAAIARAGARIELPTWRQRVARYIHDVRDQLDQEELRFFHVEAGR